MKCLTLCMNRKIRAVSQFKNFNFSSLVKFRGAHLACNPEGLFSLGGDTDNDAFISSYFRPIETDFGAANVKALRFAYVGADTAADLKLETFPDDTDDPKEYAIVPTKEGQQTIRVPMQRVQTGRYWGFQISNENGADFSVDSVQILVKPLAYGHR